MANDFGAAVRSRRKALKWTQKALAKRVGCTDAYISEIENSRKEPGDGLRAKIMEILDLRDMPVELSPELGKVISLGSAPSISGAPSLRLAPEIDERPEAEVYREIFQDALTTAALAGWSPGGPGTDVLHAPRLLGPTNRGVLATARLHTPELAHTPSGTPRRAIIHGPAPVEGRIDNARLERAFHLRQALPDLPVFGGPPALAYLPREVFPQRAQSRFELPETIAVLIFPGGELGRLASDFSVCTLDQSALMGRGVQNARDLLSWCVIARDLIGALLGLGAAGWAHRDLHPANLLLQTSCGLAQGLRAVDYDTAAPLSRDCLPFVDTPEIWHWTPDRIAASDPRRGPTQGAWIPEPHREDRYAVGAVLAHLLAGPLARRLPPVSGDDADPAWRAWQAQQLSDDLRFHINEGRKHPERLPERLRDELVRAYDLTHALMEQPEAQGSEQLLAHLDALERIRSEALRLLSGTGPTGGVESMLRSMGESATASQERQWCARYTTQDVEAIKVRIRPFPWMWRVLQRLDTPLPPEAMNVEQALSDCLEFLRLGFVRYATRTLIGLARLGPTEVPERDVRLMRIAVGNLLMRERDTGLARDLLERFDDVSSEEGVFIHHMSQRRWWVEVLSARLAIQEGHLSHAAQIMERLPRPDPETHPRAWTWFLLLEVMHSLASGHSPGPLRDRLAMARRWTESTPESLLMAMLLARCDAALGDLEQALRWLSAGLGEATSRQFPVEAATLMVLAAEVIRDAFSRPDHRRRLEFRGEDPGAVLDAAEALALRSGDIFWQLGLAEQVERAVIAAGDCAHLRADAPSLARAFGWFTLAQNNSAIRDAEPLEGLQDRLEATRAAWLTAARGHEVDPGIARRRDWIERAGPVALSLWGGDRLTYAASDPNGSGLGSALSELLEAHLHEPPRTILDLGCGAGADARALAQHFPSAQVIGADVSPWSIREARRLHAVAPGRLVFHCIEPGALLTGRINLGQPDLVIMRGSLQSVAFQQPWLDALATALTPGALLVCLDLVQVRPSGPGAWRRTLDANHAIAIRPLSALTEALEHAGFELLTPHPHDDRDNVANMLRDRLDRLSAGRDRDARLLHERPGALDRLRAEAEPLIEALSGQGALGWVGTVARFT